MQSHLLHILLGVLCSLLHVDACAPLVWPVLASRGHPVASPRLGAVHANGVTSVE
jgi:hypothetical protein